MKFKVMVCREVVEEYEVEASDEDDAEELWGDFDAVKVHDCLRADILSIEEV